MAQAQNNNQQFDAQEFITQMAEQAEGLVPADIGLEDKKYITNTVHNFCSLAFDAIEQATMVTQLIGEWTFHKSIDLIRAQIMPQFRDEILQNIAFVTFEISKLAISKQMTQDQIILVVEQHVNQKYAECLNELKDRGKISPEDFDAAMGQSNIDKMAEEQNEQEPLPPEPQEDNFEDISDSKLLKLVSFAMLLQKMDPNKAEAVMSRFNQREADILRDYYKMDDLSSKIDQTLIVQYMAELKAGMPTPTNLSDDRLQSKLAKIVTKKNESKINDIILKERDGIKKYISEIRENKQAQLPSRVSNIVYSYILEKVGK